MGKGKFIACKKVTTQWEKYSLEKDEQGVWEGRGGNCDPDHRGSREASPWRWPRVDSIAWSSVRPAENRGNTHSAGGGASTKVQRLKSSCSMRGAPFGGCLGQAVSGERLRQWDRWGGQDLNHRASWIPMSGRLIQQVTGSHLQVLIRTVHSQILFTKIRLILVWRGSREADGKGWDWWSQGAVRELAGTSVCSSHGKEWSTRTQT